MPRPFLPGIMVVWLLAATAHAQPAFVQQLIQQRCRDCHSGDEPAAELTLPPAEANEQQWARVFHALATAQMPPADAEPLGSADRSRLLHWLKRRLAGTELIAEWQRKQLFPEYGNHVEHGQLFDGSITAPSWSPARLWKKSPHIFDSLANRGMGFRPGRYGARSAQLSKLKQPFTMEDKAGIKDYAAIALADSATLGTMLRNAETLVDNHLAGAMYELRERREGPIPEDELPRDKNGKPQHPRFPATPDTFRGIMLATDRVDDTAVNAAIDTMFQLVIERSPTDAELDKYRQLMRVCAESSNQVEGMRMMLVAIAISPDAIYRMELGQGPMDQYGRRMLGPADLAFAIAYALTDQKPDEQLLAAAASGRLRTREDVAREVARYWDDDDIEKPRILRFFHEFFGYAAAPGVFKDAARFGKDYRNVPEQLVKDADTLVLHIVHQDQDVLAQLLTTDKYFVAHSGDNDTERETHEALRKFYEYYKDKPWREFPYQVPKEHMQYVRSLHRMFTHANGNVTKRWMNYLEQCDKAGIRHMPMQNGRDYITAYNLDDKSFDFPVEQPFSLARAINNGRHNGANQGANSAIDGRPSERPNERIGILMHPAWLIAHSLNLDNDPVRRGKWIRERLLADTVPELPITVDARIPDDAHKTLRERFAVTREESCWRCHVKMNPLGMPFELYDDFGRHRTVEVVASAAPVVDQSVSPTGRGPERPRLDRSFSPTGRGPERPRLDRSFSPTGRGPERPRLDQSVSPTGRGPERPRLDCSGFLAGTGDPDLDGSVQDPLDLMRRLAKSERVRQSFVRHAFRYWMGRNEMLSDSSVLIGADRAYVESDGSFRALALSLLTSDAFLYRKTEPSAATASSPSHSDRTNHE